MHGSAIDATVVEGMARALSSAARGSPLPALELSLAGLAVGHRLDDVHLACLVRAAASRGAGVSAFACRRTRLGPRTLDELASALPGIRRLELASCGVGSNLMTPCTGMAAGHLAYLTLDGNRGVADAEAACATFALLLAGGTLRSLHVRNTALTGEQLEFIVSGVARSRSGLAPALVDLRVGENDLGSETGVRGLSRLVRLCPELKSLEAARCRLTSSGAVHLAGAVRCRRQTLERLVLARNPLTDAAVPPLRAMLLAGTSDGGRMVELDLFGCLLGIQGAAALVAAASRAPRLRRLDVDGDVDVWSHSGSASATSRGAAVRTGGSANDTLPEDEQQCEWDALMLSTQSAASCAVPWLCRLVRMSGRAGPAGGTIGPREEPPDPVPAAAGSGPVAAASLPPPRAALGLTSRRLLSHTATRDPLKVAAPGCCRLSVARLVRSIQTKRAMQARRRALLCRKALRCLPADVAELVFTAAWGPGRVSGPEDTLRVAW